MLQEIIDAAAKLTGTRPVVHLPPGICRIEQTLRIPANTDLQLIGDGQRSTLRWTGQGAGPLLHIQGPSHVTLCDFGIWGALGYNGTPAVQAIRMDGVDQPGGRIYGEEIWPEGNTYSLLLHDLKQTRVELHGAQPHGGDAAHATITVDNASLAMFGAATSGDARMYEVRNGGKLLVRDTWFEGQAPVFMRLADRGTVTFDGGKVSCQPKGGLQDAPVVVDGFHGKLALLGFQFSENSWFAVRGEQADTRVLLLGTILGNMEPRLEVSSKTAKVGVLASRRFEEVNKRWGTGVQPDQGTLDPAFLREMLADVRAARPGLPTPHAAGVTDVRLFRVEVQDAGAGMEIAP